MKTTSNTNKEICVWPSFASGLCLAGAPCRRLNPGAFAAGYLLCDRGQQKMK
ncbi:hypothetical protein [Collimonas fungivorans]|uniref:hypothetical protein n=1 Tax=Collimonas fungivorans TaxID=158899 RepID=UPI003FA39D09